MIMGMMAKGSQNDWTNRTVMKGKCLVSYNLEPVFYHRLYGYNFSTIIFGSSMDLRRGLALMQIFVRSSLKLGWQVCKIAIGSMVSTWHDYSNIQVKQTKNYRLWKPVDKKFHPIWLDNGYNAERDTGVATPNTTLIHDKSSALPYT